MRLLSSSAVASLLLGLAVVLPSATPSFAKAHNNGVKDVVEAVKAGDLDLQDGIKGIGNTAPVAPGDGDAADTTAIDRNSKEYTSTTGNPGRDGTLPGLKR